MLESLYKHFQFPAEGSYLHEAVDGKRTPLMNESLEYEGTPSNSVPVRLLEDFIFFDPRTLALVSLSCLSEGRGFCEAFGRAFAECDEEDWDDRDVIQDDGVWLHISNIMNWSLDIYQECIFPSLISESR